MADFWIAIFLTTLLALLTVLLNWMAARVIYGSRIVGVIRDIAVGAGGDLLELRQRLQSEIARFDENQSTSNVWGADLSTLALSLDFTCLGIWIHKPSLFPFFSRFNSESVFREIPIWVLVIGFQSILVLVVLLFKHKHATVVCESKLDDGLKQGMSLVIRNFWLLLANFSGAGSLLLSLCIMLNAF